jgi:hypothetical protein
MVLLSDTNSLLSVSYPPSAKLATTLALVKLALMELSLILIRKTVSFVTLTAHLVLALPSALWFVRQAIFSTITQIAPAVFHTVSFALTKTLVLLASRTSISMATTQSALKL